METAASRFNGKLTKWNAERGFGFVVAAEMNLTPNAFVFLGKPPKSFGVAWIHDGKVTSLKEFADEHHLLQPEVGRLIVQLGEAYLHARETPRYSAEFGGKQMLVLPSKGLEQEMHQIMANTLH